MREVEANVAELRRQLEARTRERDDAIREANRRDQKWMDGINECIGERLEYCDPCARNGVSVALEKWAKEKKSQLEADEKTIKELDAVIENRNRHELLPSENCACPCCNLHRKLKCEITKAEAVEKACADYRHMLLEFADQDAEQDTSAYAAWLLLQSSSHGTIAAIKAQI
jgi:hypothetical protein